jgi:hypothetical protein
VGAVLTCEPFELEHSWSACFGAACVAETWLDWAPPQLHLSSVLELRADSLLSAGYDV